VCSVFQKWSERRGTQGIRVEYLFCNATNRRIVKKVKVREAEKGVEVAVVLG